MAHERAYGYVRGDGVAVAQPLFQEEGSGSIPTSPLQLVFREIEPATACELCALWHSRLPRIQELNIRMSPWACYAAEFDNGLYAVGIWSKPVARLLNDKPWIELRRLAICDKAPKFTASRMLGWMAKQVKLKYPHLELAISYQDTEVHTGTIYKASGWRPSDWQRLNGGRSWGGGLERPNRWRRKSQSEAIKVRWEKAL